MNIKSARIPGAIVRRMVAIIAAAVGFLVVGLVWSSVASDRGMVLLSVLLALMCLVKAVFFYLQMREGKYESAEGVVISKRNLIARRCLEVVLQSDEEAVTLVLNGKPNLRVGGCYRLYLERQPEAIQEMQIGKTLQPGRSLLGLEQLSE